MKMSSSNNYMNPFATVKLKKAPQAPRRFKSSYMFFSTAKHKEIRAELNAKGEGKLNTTEVAKMVSKAWKELNDEDREKWEEMARQDKARYEMEKSMYTGPWKVPATRKRMSKDPKAPKRPMSAFLSFSNSKRGEVKDNNRTATNAEISRILALMWKDASDEEKKLYVDEEFRLRQQYKTAMSQYKKLIDEENKSKRQVRENEAIQAIRDGKTPAECQQLAQAQIEAQAQSSQAQSNSNTDNIHDSSNRYYEKKGRRKNGGGGSGDGNSPFDLTNNTASSPYSYRSQMASDIFAPPISSSSAGAPSLSSSQLYGQYPNPSSAASGPAGGDMSDPYGGGSNPPPGTDPYLQQHPYYRHRQHPQFHHYPYPPIGSSYYNTQDAAAAAAADRYGRNVYEQFNPYGHPSLAAASTAAAGFRPYPKVGGSGGTTRVGVGGGPSTAAAASDPSSPPRPSSYNDIGAISASDPHNLLYNGTNRGDGGGSSGGGFGIADGQISNPYNDRRYDTTAGTAAGMGIVGGSNGSSGIAAAGGYDPSAASSYNPYGYLPPSSQSQQYYPQQDYSLGGRGGTSSPYGTNSNGATDHHHQQQQYNQDLLLSQQQQRAQPSPMSSTLPPQSAYFHFGDSDAIANPNQQG